MEIAASCAPNNKPGSLSASLSSSWPGLSRPSVVAVCRYWMAGTSPAMTKVTPTANRVHPGRRSARVRDVMGSTAPAMTGGRILTRVHPNALRRRQSAIVYRPLFRHLPCVPATRRGRERSPSAAEGATGPRKRSGTRDRVGIRDLWKAGRRAMRLPHRRGKGRPRAP